MFGKVIVMSLVLGFGATTAQAMTVGPVDNAPASTIEASGAQVHLIGNQNYKPAKRFVKRTRKSRHAASGNFKGNGRVVKDTCPGGNQTCIDDLIASCNKAGGGLSTEPDGGVDCFVVGIHDQ